MEGSAGLGPQPPPTAHVATGCFLSHRAHQAGRGWENHVPRHVLGAGGHTGQQGSWGDSSGLKARLLAL